MVAMSLNLRAELRRWGREEAEGGGVDRRHELGLLVMILADAFIYFSGLTGMK